MPNTSKGSRSHKPGCKCPLCRRKRLPLGTSIASEGPVFATSSVHVDEGDYIGRRRVGGQEIDVVYTEPTEQLPPMRKAAAGRKRRVCGAILSRYNDNDQCQCH